ncbi:MAG: cell division protein ZapA [bacterium]|nr:cell division protein ZapA [bacterium]
MNKVKLKIAGTEYLINTEDDVNNMKRLGDELNAKIEAISRHSTFLSTTMAAVMAALEYCEQAKKVSEEAEQLRSELKKRVEAEACSKIELSEARREIERLSRENRQLRIGNSRV